MDDRKYDCETTVLIPFKAGQWFKQQQYPIDGWTKELVLIPFKAGQWFKRIRLFILLHDAVVLIPFKAGQWFKQGIVTYLLLKDVVLIPFKAGQWFKRVIFRESPVCPCLNPF